MQTTESSASGTRVAPALAAVRGAAVNPEGPVSELPPECLVMRERDYEAMPTGSLRVSRKGVFCDAGTRAVRVAANTYGSVFWELQKVCPTCGPRGGITREENLRPPMPVSTRNRVPLAKTKSVNRLPSSPQTCKLSILLANSPLLPAAPGLPSQPHRQVLPLHHSFPRSLSPSAKCTWPLPFTGCTFNGKRWLGCAHARRAPGRPWLPVPPGQGRSCPLGFAWELACPSCLAGRPGRAAVTAGVRARGWQQVPPKPPPALWLLSHQGVSASSGKRASLSCCSATRKQNPGTPRPPPPNT